MNSDQIKFLVKVLHKIDFFSKCSSNEIDMLLEKFKVHSYSRGKTIIEKEKTGRHFYIIYEGKVGVLSQKGFFSRKIIARLKEGDYFGEISTVLDIPSTAFVQALTSVTLFSIGKEELLSVMKNNPDLKQNISQTALKRKEDTEKNSQD